MLTLEVVEQENREGISKLLSQWSPNVQEAETNTVEEEILWKKHTPTWLMEEVILQYYCNVFKPDFGKSLGSPVHIELACFIIPVCAQTYPVPMAKFEKDIYHNQNLTQFFEKCSNQDLWLSVKKLQVKSPSFSFMGHKLTDKGAEPNPTKVVALAGMPTPTDKARVQCFLECAKTWASFIKPFLK